jgi:acetyl-CoA C-acetyltransferase
MTNDPIVIAAARRTPLGAFLGTLSAVSATDLAATAIAASIADSGVDPAEITEVLLGCVLPAGLGQAPARQAALAGGIPKSVPCTTVSKVCGSGMKAAMIAHDMIVAGSASVVVCGGIDRHRDLGQHVADDGDHGEIPAGGR